MALSLRALLVYRQARTPRDCHVREGRTIVQSDQSRRQRRDAAPRRNADVPASGLPGGRATSRSRRSQGAAERNPGAHRRAVAQPTPGPTAEPTAAPTPPPSPDPTAQPQNATAAPSATASAGPVQGELRPRAPRRFRRRSREGHLPGRSQPWQLQVRRSAGGSSTAMSPIAPPMRTTVQEWVRPRSLAGKIGQAMSLNGASQ